MRVEREEENEPDERFWTELRQAVAAARSIGQSELEAAERLLAEAASAADPPLAPERIDAIVQAVLAGDAQRQPVVRRSRFPGLSSSLSAAAAVLIGSKMLIAAVAVAAVTVVALTVRYSTQSLGFVDAVHLLVDERQSEAIRTAAQGTLWIDLADAIQLLQSLSRGDGQLAAGAQAVLDALRVQVADTSPFQRRMFDDQPFDLSHQLRDPALSSGHQYEALARLQPLLAYGVAALLEVARRGGPPALALDNEMILRELRQLIR